MNEHYSASSDVFVVMLETPKGGASKYPVVVLTDMLDAKLTHDVEGVQNVISHSDYIMGLNAGFMEGFVKWLGHNPEAMCS